MPSSVTARAERDEIFFDIVSQSTARAEVMDLKILRSAAVLAVPPVACEHLAAELAIRLGFKPQSRLLPFELVQVRSSPRPETAASAAREER
jgi:hypothetical protein